MSGRPVCYFISDESNPDWCRNLAKYEIFYGFNPGPDDNSLACAEHLEKLLDDRSHFLIDRLPRNEGGVLWDDMGLCGTHGQIGDWHFSNNDNDLWLRIPSPDGLPRGEFVHLYLCREGQEPANKPAWLWDGNREAPTLSPSIRTSDEKGERWHGYLKAGILESA